VNLISFIAWVSIITLVHEASHFVIGRLAFRTGVEHVQIFGGKSAKFWLVGDVTLSVGSDPLDRRLGIPLPAGGYNLFASQGVWETYVKTYSSKQLELLKRSYPKRYEVLSSPEWWYDRKPHWVRFFICAAGPLSHVVLHLLSMSLKKVTKDVTTQVGSYEFFAQIRNAS
jgi:membrane-associated protease RseP (regulator of RpoE activity)